MATASQRRAATRRALAAQRQGRKAVPSNVHKAIKDATHAQARRWISGQDKITTVAERKQAARLGSLSYHHKAPPEYLPAFQQYFYHDEKKAEAAIEDEEYDENEEELERL